MPSLNTARISLSSSNVLNCLLKLPSERLTAAQRRLLTDTVVTDAAVRSARRPEDFAGVAVLQLDDLVVDLDVADSGRGPLARRDVHVGGLCKHGP